MLRLLGILILVVIGIAAAFGCLVLTLAHAPWWTYILVTVPVWFPVGVWYAVAKLGIPAFLKVAIEVMLIAIVAFTCLALGGTPAWTWVVLEGMVGLAVILWALRMAVERRLVYVKTPLNLLLILLVLYIFFQLVPMPAGILRSFQPNTLRVYTVGLPQVREAASEPLQDGTSYPLSLNRWSTREHLFLYMAYVGFFLVFLNNMTGRQQLGRMLGVLVALGAIVAIAGFSTLRQDERLLYRWFPVGGANEKPAFLNADTNPEFSAGYGFVFGVQEGDATDFYVPKVHGGDVFGGFPSSNSAATVLVMVLLVALGVFFAYISTRRDEWGGSGGLLYTREGNITLLVFFVAALLVYGLGISRSRGGIVVLVALLPVLVLLVAFSRSLLAGIITVVVVALLLVTPLAVVGRSPAIDFLSEKAAVWLNPWQEDVRFLGRESAWLIAGDFPLFGTGLGTFASVYPAYKIHGPVLYFAHCDLLQWMAEMGLVGMILGGAILLTGLWTVIVGWFRLKDPFFRRLLLGSALGCVAFLAHGLVDFPLQIPGVVIIFVTLAAVSIVVARDRVARHEERDFIF